MIEALHLGSMLPATLGACCVAGGADRRSPLAWLGMLTMLAAMADTMLLARPVIAPVVWSAVLVTLALASAIRLRLRADSGATAHPVRTMAAHRALQAVVMAGLILLASGHHAPGSPPHDGHGEHGFPVVAVVAVAALAFAAASTTIALRRRLPVLPRMEAALGAVSIALMALPLVA
ncbi:hypothetical protein ACFVU2_08035 [Leifsonia sp. NPDC058194]|uniref:hypothetical protein n=1 Tax=Leifsonia sp. NPDC058194 TaxID=3346374 RepID=UPI0036DCB1A5